MKKYISGTFQYSLLLIITFSLLWLALNRIEVGDEGSKIGFILSIWGSSNKLYLILSGLLAIISHVIRAERWKLLIRPTGYNLTFSESFHSVMVGYFVNLAIPRGGEFSRCYNLYRLNKTPIDISFGTVLAERVVDLIILLSLIALSFTIQFDNLVHFFRQINIPLDIKNWGLLTKLGIAALGLLIILALYLVLKQFLGDKLSLMQGKLKSMIEGLKKGLYSVFANKKKALFFTYSILIWLLYYLMSYFIIMAFTETAVLSMMDTLTVFVIGGIAMAIPLPGGTGSYHVLVPLGLVTLFGIGQDEAVAFSFIFHGWQTLIVIVIGVFSLLTSQYIVKKNKL